MSKEISTSKRNDAFNNILRFFTEGDIALSPEDELILARWNTAHRYMLQRKLSTEEIAQKIKELHAVSIYTARNDVYQAQALFGSAIKANKRFLLYQHAEWLQLFMNQCKTDKSLVNLVPKLAREYTNAIKEMPEDTNKSTMPPPVMNFFIVEGQKMNAEGSAEDVIKRLRLKHSHGHEYITPEEEPTDESTANS